MHCAHGWRRDGSVPLLLSPVTLNAGLRDTLLHVPAALSIPPIPVRQQMDAHAGSLYLPQWPDHAPFIRLLKISVPAKLMSGSGSWTAFIAFAGRTPSASKTDLVISSG